MNQQLWITNEIFNWYINLESSRIIAEKEWMRSYEIWEYSKTVIENAQNDFQLADGITNLKRSLNQRLKLIEDLYRLKSIEYTNKPSGYLELLEQYGLVRPYIMKVLLTIRNDIEHNDATPPDMSRCRELVDVIWYFLKSTDYIVRLQNEGGAFTLLDENGYETKYWVSIEIDFKNRHNTKIYGCLPEELTSYKEKYNYLKVNNIEIKFKKNYKDRGLHQERLDTGISFNGELVLDSNEKFQLLKRYFTMY